MKTYSFAKTNIPNLYRIVDRKGNWDHYFLGKLGKDRTPKGGQVLRAVSHITRTGWPMGKGFEQYLKNGQKEELERTLQEAGARGDRVHKYIDIALAPGRGTRRVLQREQKVWSEDLQQEVSLEDEDWKYVLSWENWWKLHEPVVVAHEGSLYNTQVGYAGTMDFIGILTKACGLKWSNGKCPCEKIIGKLGLVDWKTSNKIRNTYGPQTEAYAQAENVREYIGKKKIEWTGALRLGTEHKVTRGYEFKAYTAEERKQNLQDFLVALHVTNRVEELFNIERRIHEVPDHIEIVVRRRNLAPKKPARKIAAKKSKKR